MINNSAHFECLWKDTNSEFYSLYKHFKDIGFSNVLFLYYD